MITWADGLELIRNVISTLPQEDQDKFDSEKTDRLNSGRYMYGSVKIGFKDGTPKETLWRVKKWMDNIVKPAETRPQPPPGLNYPTLDTIIHGLSTTIDASKIRCLVECPPWKRDHVKAVARFCGCWRSKTAALVDIPVKGE
eukprot:6116574-Pyramimonas_sp.AAC.1